MTMFIREFYQSGEISIIMSSCQLEQLFQWVGGGGAQHELLS